MDISAMAVMPRFSDPGVIAPDPDAYLDFVMSSGDGLQQARVYYCTAQELYLTKTYCRDTVYDEWRFIEEGGSEKPEEFSEAMFIAQAWMHCHREPV